MQHYLYVSIDEVLCASAVNPVLAGDLLQLRNCPVWFLSITVEPNQDLFINLTARPAAYLSKLRHCARNKADTYYIVN